MKIIVNASICLIVLFPFCGLSQNYKYTKSIDSLIEITNKRPDDSLKVAGYGTLYEQLMFRDPDMSFIYAKKEYALSKKIGYKPGIAAGQLHFADYFKDRGKIDSARYYYLQSIQGYTALNSTIGILFVNHSLASFEKSLGNYDSALALVNRNIEIYKNRDTVFTQHGGAFNLIGAEYELLGGIHQEMGNYRIALKETLNALKFFEEEKDTLRQADALMQIGALERNLENFESALTHTKKAYHIYGNFEDKQYKCYAANGIGDTYLNLGKPEEALNYFEDALKLSQEIKNRDIEGNSLVNLGMANSAIGKINRAIDFFLKGLTIHEELGYQKVISMDLNGLAEAQTKAGNFKAALDNLSRSISIAKEIGAKDNLSEAYSLRYAVNKSLGSLEDALADHEMFKAVNDSIFNTTKSQQIQELRTIYETEKKEQQIALQENEIVLLEEKQRAATLQNTLLIVGIIAILSLFGLLYYGIRQKMKRNKVEKEKVDAELAFKKKELTTHALNLARKNETLENLKLKAQEFKEKENTRAGYNQLIRSINFDLQDDNNWQNFSRYFEEVHKNFNRNVKTKYPKVTSNELRLLALLKMNLSSKEIASILNISAEGIKKARYRLRKKLNITTEDSLQDLVLGL
ncbi:tetratricopeptide repeat protein [Pricia sp. S334]|uniref:Tetratricopeptide repeat protein n=1 Tax=Pricia mediterranea TaxID=3076079 RepID=A0ABU3L860_9FLAO|nr:tetratricopeptide repeat protein [Pricia sp. S334]MDT7829558.1 tetratricopeptide repeat protein [Pricia sp. S334]